MPLVAVWSSCGRLALWLLARLTHSSSWLQTEPSSDRLACSNDPGCRFNLCDPVSLLKHRKRFHEYIPSPQSPVRPKADKPKKDTQPSQFSFAEASTSASSLVTTINHPRSLPNPTNPPTTSRLDQNLKDPLKLVYPCFHPSMQEVIHLPIFLSCFEESNT